MDLTTFVGKLLSEQDADVLHEGVQVLAQALMEAMSPPRLARGATNATRRAPSTATATGPEPGTPGWGPSCCGSRRCRRGAAPRRCSSPAGAPSRPSPASCRRLTSTGSSSARSTPSSRRSGSTDLEVPGVADLPGARRAGRGLPHEAHLEQPYLWLDATFHKVRKDGRVVSAATVVAVGVSTIEERRFFGVDCGPAEDHAF